MRSLRWFPRSVVFLVCLLWSLAGAQSPPEPLQVLRVTPAGDDVPSGRQIVVTFNRPVVPVGRMERRAEEIPISITPPVACAWRWLNTTALACLLNEQDALALATEYTVTIRPGITAQDGATLAAEVTQKFLTQRPRVVAARFTTWDAPGIPMITATFNQPVTRASVAQHLFMELESEKRVALKVDAVPETQGRGWLVRPILGLPLDTQVTLRVEPGIVSTRGSVPGTETRTVVTFDTFPALRFLGVECTVSNAGNVILLPNTLDTEPRCSPVQPVSLLFSAPVRPATLQAALHVTPALVPEREDALWPADTESAVLRQPYRRDRPYRITLPSALQAQTTYKLHVPPKQLKDAFGRVLEEAIDVQFATDHLPPDYALRHPFAVLEEQVETHVPLEVVNLTEVSLHYDTLTAAGIQTGQHYKVPLRPLLDRGYVVPLPMRTLIPASSGVIQGVLQTTPIVADSIEARWFFSQVTPFAVHVKIGHYTTLVWVTRLDTGLPVADARVQIAVERFGTLEAQPRLLAEARTDHEGIATLAGTSLLDPSLQLLNTWEHALPHLSIRLSKDGSMAVVPLIDALHTEARDHSQGYIPTSLEKRHGHIRAWGTTPQGVYRLGDTVHYKIYVRDQDNQRLVPAPRTTYALQVIDPMDKVVHEVENLGLSAFGAYDGAFPVPDNGAVGWYRFKLSSTFGAEAPEQDESVNREDSETWRTWEPMTVLVSDFTPAPFRVTTDLHGTSFSAHETVTVTTQARLHAGGPYGEAEARIAALVHSQPLVPGDPQATGFFFSTRVPTPQDARPSGDAGEEDDEEQLERAAEDDNADASTDTSADTTTATTLFETEDRLDASGTLTSTLTLNDVDVVYGRLRVESAIRDDRGKYIAGYAYARYTGRDRYVGLRQSDWLLTAGTPAQVHTLVVNDQGQAAAGTVVHIQVERLQRQASQVKGAGDVYLPHYVRSWVPVATCPWLSEATPGTCAFTPAAAGLYKVTARIVDTRGRSHSSSIQRWATGPDVVLWETPRGHSLQIVPERQEYKVGETARYLVQNPFPGARALITIERFGVQRSWQEVFPTSTAVVEVPITLDHIPGFYLSVVVVSPRVDAPLGEGQIDLGKPAFRMGYVRVPVRDTAKELLVDVRPRDAVYKPRQVATVDLQVRTRQGDIPPVELAVAVLDEAVFDLIARGRDYFDPYKGLYKLAPLDVANYNLLRQLVGRQKFDKKGANPGGDGGRDLDLRSVFKFVSYWNPTLLPDAAGKATIRFELPDNLTGWRVLAMAVTPEDRLGLGEGHFQTNKPTEIRPALPNQVTVGDRFEARFTVMNRTDTTRTLAVALRATGPVQDTAEVQQRVDAEPYKRYPVTLPIQTTQSGEITLHVRAGDGHDQDALTLPLVVRKRTALEVAATYGTTTADAVTETLAFPGDMRTDVGHVSVVATPTVIGNVDGAFQYMRQYPYACWEQKLTKGVMAAHYRQLAPYLPSTRTWPESADLPQQTLDLASRYQAPNGGMVYFVARDEYVSPDLSAYTALALQWLRAHGYHIPTPVEDKLHAYLHMFLRQDVVPDFYTPGMSATVRAMALAALAPAGQLSRAEMQRYHPHVPAMSLFGKAHYLLALTQVPDTQDMQTEVRHLIQAHANETGGKLVFSEDVDIAYQRILDSSLRANCAILSALLAYEDANKGRVPASDIPYKLTQAITQARQQRDYWENTQENMFCMNALIDFRRAYEATAPQFTFRAALDGVPMGETQFRGVQDAPVDFQRPLQPGDTGSTATLTLQRQGQGRVYYATRLFYSPANLKTEPINAGMEVHREYSVERGRGWLLLANPMTMQVGELVRVDLYLSLPTARHFVVVDDPVPGGLEPVNRDLATASQTDADKAKGSYAGASFWFRHTDWREFGYTHWSFYHRELRHHAARFYAEYLPAGKYHLSYVAQAIAPGEFTVMPAHAEEMYHPDTFGQSPPAVLRVVQEGRKEAQQ